MAYEWWKSTVVGTDETVQMDEGSDWSCFDEVLTHLPKRLKGIDSTNIQGDHRNIEQGVNIQTSTDRNPGNDQQREDEHAVSAYVEIVESDISEPGPSDVNEVHQVGEDTEASKKKGELCDNFNCNKEQFNICQREGCQCKLCFEHILYNDPCNNHNQFVHILSNIRADMSNTQKPLDLGVHSVSMTEADEKGSETSVSLDSHADVSKDGGKKTEGRESLSRRNTAADRKEMAGSSHFVVNLNKEIHEELNSGNTNLTAGEEVKEVAQFILDPPSNTLLVPSELHEASGIDSSQSSAACKEVEKVLRPEILADDNEPCKNKTLAKMTLRAESKHRRNRGLSYKSRHSGKDVPGRLDKPLGPGCDRSNSRCTSRNFMCGHLTVDQRQRIKTAYFETGDLQSQREWIVRYIEVESAVAKKAGGRRNNTIHYFLPRPTDMKITDSNKIAVCKKMFFDTLGIAERQVRTSLEKVTDEGVVEKEGRGGRPEKLKEIDEKLQAEIKSHINKFPRKESHFCHATSAYQYLSSDLSVAIMYDLYKSENPDGASRSLYGKVLKSMKLKFYRPKEGQSYICSSTSEDTDEEMERLYPPYQQHTADKE